MDEGRGKKCGFKDLKGEKKRLGGAGFPEDPGSEPGSRAITDVKKNIT